MASNTYGQRLRQLVQDNEIDTVIRELSDLLQNSPHLDEALLQSARWNDLKKQIRLGQLPYEQSNVSRNQIIAALLELISEIEEKTSDSNIGKEVDQYAQSVSGKNVIVGSQIQAGGNVTIGDQIQHISESGASRKIRLFLFIFVPVLAITVGVLYYQYRQSQQALTLTVSLDNKMPNPHLPFDGGTVILRYNGKADTQMVKTEAIFRAIPSNNRNETIDLKFMAQGFQTLDTSILLNKEMVTLPIRRDDTFRQLYGKVIDENGAPIENARVKLDDAKLETYTDAEGEFDLSIPFDQQRKKQRLIVSKKGYQTFDRTEPVIRNTATRIMLIQN